MIVDSALYRDGKRVTPAGRTADLESDFASLDPATDFIWVGLHQPSVAEMKRVAVAFHLHPLAVEDAVLAHQRPKLEKYAEDQHFMVLKTLWYVDESDAVETGEIAIFVGPGYVVTVRHGQGAELAVARRNLEAQDKVLKFGPFSVLYSVCDRVVDGYEVVGQELQTDVDEVELSVFDETRTGDTRRIYTLKREVAEFRRAVGPLRDPLTRFAEKRVPGMPAAAADYFRDVADHTIRVNELVESLDALLSSAHDALTAKISVQQNDDMRKISAWVAVAAVPTLLAGIYGMNFNDMPELSWRWGYFALLGLMALACFTLHRLFKRSGWL
ncbi:MAG: magnesium and cobalt transport protein CorA [Sciscionella sp.]